MPKLTIAIPARNELFLADTLRDALRNIRDDTEIVAVLDGAPAVTPLPEDPRLTVAYVPQSMGQRAATNLAVRLSHAEYVMKVDAHCAFDEGFDAKLMADMQPDWTVVPIMRNLHVFDWVCTNTECGTRRYQGRSGPCEKCGAPTERDVVWIAKTNPQSASYCFDPEPHFNYFREFNKRPEGKGDLTPTMSLQGSCFMLTREKYNALNICDEAFGSWGSQGIEVACKTWLSGGEVMVNHKTWYAHCFRSQGGDFGFPYALSGNQVDHAKKHARDLFFNNKWPKQVRPLSWLVKKFWPVPGWTEEDLATVSVKDFPGFYLRDNLLSMSKVVGSSIDSIADGTTSRLPRDLGGEEVSVGAVSLSAIDVSDGATGSKHVLLVGHEAQMDRVTATGILTGMMQDGNVASSPAVGKRFDQPGINEPMNKNNIASVSNVSVPELVAGSAPKPAITEGVKVVDGDFTEDTINSISGQSEGFCDIFTASHSIPPLQVSSELEPGRSLHRSGSPLIIPPKSIIYYTDNRLDPRIDAAVRAQLLRAGLPIVSASLVPIDFGHNIVVEGERGYLTMFRQILAALEASDAEIVFHCEHDVLYHPSHFEFLPAQNNIFYYNENRWMVDAVEGRALFHYARSTSGLCAYRELLLAHYRKRVQMVEEHGFSLRMGFEPGTHHRPERVDDYGCESWMSPAPNIDLRHDQNLTPSRWSKGQFRNQRYTRGWTEADAIPFWGVTRDRMPALLEEVANGMSV